MFAAIPIEVQQAQAPKTRATANATLVAINVVAYSLGISASWHIGPGQNWWSVLGYGFAHASVWHLIGNMYVLLLVGNPVNRRVGNSYYVAAYCGTIVAMGILGRISGVGPLMGASGAIYCIIGIFLLLMPAAIVRLSYVALFPVSVLVGLVISPRDWLEWFIRYGTFRVRAWWSLILVPLMELWGFFWWRTTLGSWQWNHLAHLIGLACGVAVVLMLPKRISMGTRTAAY